LENKKEAMNNSEIVKEILEEFRKNFSQKNLDGMRRFGINVKNGFGTSSQFYKSLAKKYKKNHEVALLLWQTGVHDARILAGYLADPKKLTIKQMNEWMQDFNSWDICDSTLMRLFNYSPLAYDLAFKWVNQEGEYQRRAGFVLMASISVHDKNREDKDFIAFFPLIKKYSSDERNFVKKAVNWCIRQIGKRNIELNKAAINLSEELLLSESKSAQWIAKGALRELKDKKYQDYILRRSEKHNKK
jgi:3-methyladenine DNA glycosylase AlkD